MNPQLLPQAIIDAIENPIILKNQFGVVISCNRAYLQFCNLPASKIIGFTAYDFLCKEEADFITRADQELLEGKKEVLQYTHSSMQGAIPIYSREIHKSIIRTPENKGFVILVVIGREASILTPSTKMHLTPRESMVLESLVRGNSQKLIANQLKLSPYTVADYCKSIYLKLGVHSRTEAQLLAITRLGIKAGKS